MDAWVSNTPNLLIRSVCSLQPGSDWHKRKEGGVVAVEVVRTGPVSPLDILYSFVPQSLDSFYTQRTPTDLFLWRESRLQVVLGIYPIQLSG